MAKTEKGRSGTPFLCKFFPLFLYHTIDDSIDSPVFLPALWGIVVGDAPVGTIALGKEAGAIDPEFFHQIVHHVFGTLLGKLHVVL